MSEFVNVDLEKMEEYINDMDRLMAEMFLSQSRVNHAYNTVKPQWYDQISSRTGEILFTAEKDIERLNSFFFKMFTRLNAGYRQLNDQYAENYNWNATFHDKELSPVLNMEEQEMTRRINGTTVEGIRSFEQKLSTYIDDTKENVKKISYACDGMGYYWKDDQYKRTSEAIEEFCSSMNRNMRELEDLQSWITMRREQFQDALEKLAQRDD